VRPPILTDDVSPFPRSLSLVPFPFSLVPFPLLSHTRAQGGNARKARGDVVPSLSLALVHAENRRWTMIAIRTVLCPVDFSPATSRQLELATRLCRAFKARLILHHNLNAMAVGAAVGWMYAADHPCLSEESALQRLVGLAESQTGLEVETHVTRGPMS